jgi:small subunit ribosomal protein S3
LPIHNYFVKENARKAEIDEYLAQELKRAGYSKVETTKTPLGTRVVIYAAKPGLVIGRRGQSIRDLTKILEEQFGVENPQISVATLENPELDPKVVASQIAQALQRGIHFRRAAYWAVQRVTEAGALGVEIAIRGKLTTDRARYEKYRAGYLPFVGESIVRQLRVAVVDTQLKQGLFGISVKLMPPNAIFPDKPVIKETGEAPALPKPVIEEVVAKAAEVPEVQEEVAEVADTEKA